jgi:hypothetical protein
MPHWRSYWLQTKQRGRTRFVWREVRASLLFWLILMPALDALVDHPPFRSFRLMVLIDLMMIPIFVIGGYLERRWKWNNLEKKYPDGSLPPWE